MLRSRNIIPALLILAAAISIALGVSTIVGGPDAVTGQVVSVESASVTTISSLTIEDNSGKLWTFVGSGTFSGFTPSHLEEHRAFRESVTVEYDELENGELSIVGLSD
jgi:DNA/RNA endonuclease YhcR with UshA esterase domain